MSSRGGGGGIAGPPSVLPFATASPDDGADDEAPAAPHAAHASEGPPEHAPQVSDDVHVAGPHHAAQEHPQQYHPAPGTPDGEPREGAAEGAAAGAEEEEDEEPDDIDL